MVSDPEAGPLNINKMKKKCANPNNLSRKGMETMRSNFPDFSSNTFPKSSRNSKSFFSSENGFIIEFIFSEISLNGFGNISSLSFGENRWFAKTENGRFAKSPKVKSIIESRVEFSFSDFSIILEIRRKIISNSNSESISARMKSARARLCSF